jgi:hypothetical protein
MSWRVAAAAGTCLLALLLPATASGAWTVYWNQLMYPNSTDNHKSSGWGNWTNHRVYHSVTPPTITHFHLEYCHTDGTCHWSADNGDTNPFY